MSKRATQISYIITNWAADGHASDVVVFHRADGARNKFLALAYAMIAGAGGLDADWGHAAIRNAKAVEFTPPPIGWVRYAAFDRNGNAANTGCRIEITIRRERI